jgi:hypothetical protein
MSDDERKILEFILNTNISIESGYSYVQILEFLEYLKYFYKDLLENRELYKRELQQQMKKNKNLEEEVEQISIRLSKKSKEFQNLCDKIARKLSLKERLTGRINIDLT